MRPHFNLSNQIERLRRSLFPEPESLPADVERRARKELAGVISSPNQKTVVAFSALQHWVDHRSPVNLGRYLLPKSEDQYVDLLLCSDGLLARPVKQYSCLEIKMLSVRQDSRFEFGPHREPQPTDFTPRTCQVLAEAMIDAARDPSAHPYHPVDSETSWFDIRPSV